MAATADIRLGLPERPKSKLADFVKGKAASAMQSTLAGIRLI